MFCPKCGTETSDDSSFCSKCGESIQATPNVPAQPLVSKTDSRVEDKGPINKKVIVGSIILGSIILVIILAIIGKNIYDNYKMQVTDDIINEMAENIGGGDNEDGDTAEGSISNVWDAYNAAASKVDYNNMGISLIKTIINPSAEQGIYEFTFIDKDSRFSKDDYNYFKGKRVQITESGQADVRDQDVLADDPGYNFGSLVLTEKKINDLIEKARSSVLAKGNQIGKVYSVIYSDGLSNSYPPTWDVSFAKAGQDETSVGIKDLSTYMVVLYDSDMSEKLSTESSLGFSVY